MGLAYLLFFCPYFSLSVFVCEKNDTLCSSVSRPFFFLFIVTFFFFVTLFAKYSKV